MDIGKMLIATGVILIIFGFLFSNLSGLPKLPGDIYIKRDNLTFSFPLATSIIISIFLTIILQLFFRK